MNIKALFSESRTFVLGRVTAASTYITGGVTTASGMAKAATENGIAPAWFPSISVDTMVLLIGAVVTVLTGLVSIWAKRQDMRNKRAAEKRDSREWIMRMLLTYGEEKMRESFGPDWRKQAADHSGDESVESEGRNT